MRSSLANKCPAASRLFRVLICCSLWLQAFGASASSISPSIDRFPVSHTPRFIFQVELLGQDTWISALIEPLTKEVGRGMDASALPIIRFSGPFVAYLPGSYYNLNISDIVWISCDVTDTSNSSGRPTDVFLKAAKFQPKAIVLYSSTTGYCTYSPGSNTTVAAAPVNVFTMVSATTVTDFTHTILGGSARNMKATIWYNSTIVDETQLNSVNGTHLPNSTNAGGGNGTTAGSQQPISQSSSPMIILYTVTSVITGLFLIMIVTGIIRAQRHPDRYGPRPAIIGRPRQTRVKGLARAVLDTLPIVKFGSNDKDDSDGAAATKDLEMEAQSSHTVEDAREIKSSQVSNKQIAGMDEIASIATVAATGTSPPKIPEGSESLSPPSEAVVEATADGRAITALLNGHPAHDIDAVDTQAHQNTGASTPILEEAVLDKRHHTCLICQTEFKAGEDLRLLPCGHPFHAECVDPWLLNVSGTCPSCRVNLQPPSEEPEDPNVASGLAETDLQNSVNASAYRGSRISRLLRRYSDRLEEVHDDASLRRAVAAAAPDPDNDSTSRPLTTRSRSGIFVRPRSALSNLIGSSTPEETTRNGGSRTPAQPVEQANQGTSTLQANSSESNESRPA